MRLIIEERDSGGWHGQTVLGRVEKEETTRKYLVDINGKLPTILCEIDTSDSSLKKSYYVVYPGLDPGLMPRYWPSGNTRRIRRFTMSTSMSTTGSAAG